MKGIFLKLKYKAMGKLRALVRQLNNGPHWIDVCVYFVNLAFTKEEHDAICNSSNWRAKYPAFVKRLEESYW